MIIIELETENVETLEVLKEVLTFEADEDSIVFLQKLEDNKMQACFDNILAGPYKRVKLMTNPNAKNGNVPNALKPYPVKKPLYFDTCAANYLITDVKISHL